ncbi:unnamed protein product [Cladocopium goreaui]|uniref:Uncharacterized protein n=1 Tax=Cladocopium goreaui TaxID=2562237 RepID=A0A9P1BQR9_9DINO|nr:unnamed protein product [Cladocopium goreaui]|mmetsp:Transcript_76867/g.156361  ORF Transcript_76867/g.156361 Transcript_76867/m.156361 type:complete len:210 (+) Transcript_76867:85-714(+)
MALLKLKTELENALGELSLHEDGMEEINSTLAQSPRAQPDIDTEDHEEPGEMAGKGGGPGWNTRMPSVGYCSTAATTPLASATASAMPSTPQEGRSGELTPRGSQECRGTELLNAPGQCDLLPGGVGHFRLGTTCLQLTKGPLKALPIQQRIEEAEAAEAKLKADLDGLGALREPGKDQAESAALDALSLAQASLQARGIPGASSSSTL